MVEERNILVVDDEKEITDLIAIYLENEGFTVHRFYRAEGVLTCAENTKIDLAILDVMLPDQDGFSLLRELRQQYFFPIIMLTAKIQDQDKILGLTLGADDYMTKPFNPLELVARVRTQLRRTTQYDAQEHGQQAEETIGTTAGKSGEQTAISIRGLFIDQSAHKAILNRKELTLTPIEFDILWYLAAHQGQVVSSEELFEKVWGEAYFESNNTVMAHIARLRAKMGDHSRRPKYVKTVWGVGYTIEK